MPATPKTGRAQEMRAWMRRRRKPFAPADVSAGLGIPPGPERERVARALRDFLRRGEVARVGQAGQGYLYLYNKAWRREETDSPLKDRIHKAIYLAGSSGVFSSAEIERLATDGTSKNFISKTIKALVDGWFLETVGRRKRERAYGLENVYRITDRERFRMEVL